MDSCPSNDAVILYLEQKMRVACDGKCHKAWGINSRPRVKLSDDPDDFAWLADDELEEAPADPGTCEGGDAKPTDLGFFPFPNKWCIRECERCAKSSVGKWQEALELPDFSRRQFNQPWKH